DPADVILVAVGISHVFEATRVVCTNEMANQARSNWPSEGQVSCLIDRLPVTPGTYRVNLYVTVNGALADFIIDAARVEVDNGGFWGCGPPPFMVSSTVLAPHSGEVRSAAGGGAAA